MLDMHFSLMLNAMDWIPGTLSVISRHLKQSVSSDMNLMLMEVLITTLSPILEEKENLDVMTRLMCEASIQTLRLAEELQRLDGITRQRMETLWQEDSRGHAKERDWIGMCRNFIRSSNARANQTFGRLFEDWLQNFCYVTFNHSGLMPRRDMLVPQLGTLTHLEFGLQVQAYRTWMNGVQGTLRHIEEERRVQVTGMSGSARGVPARPFGGPALALLPGVRQRNLGCLC